MSDEGIVIVTMAKTEIQSTRRKAVPKDLTAQQQLARLVCEVSQNLEDRTLEAILEAYLRKQT
jgi:hypothetical protein